MSLIVENGSIVPNADSYADVVETDTYHASLGNTAWAAATTPAKEIALRKATRYIDVMYRTMWLGRKVRIDQPRDWPRSNVNDSNDFWHGSNEVPLPIKQATQEMALKALSEDIFPDLDNPGRIASESVTVGPITTSTSYTGGKGQLKRFRVVDALLAEYITGSGGAGRI